MNSLALAECPQKKMLAHTFLSLFTWASIGTIIKHLFQATERVNGAIMWANLHLLFWLSLVPFETRRIDVYSGRPVEQ